MKESGLDEEQLLRLVARGNTDAFDELYRRNSPWLAVRLRRRCPDDGLVAEVLQDTFVTVWRAAGSFSDLRPKAGGDAPGGSAAGWLWTIAARRLVDALRRQSRRQEVPTDELPAGRTPTAEDEVLGGSVGDEVGAALSRLAPELQDVIRSMVLDGLTVRETSILLGVPEGTVKRRARQARQPLREALG